MLILTIRTDNPEAEIGLYEDGHKLDYEIWQGHRRLAETLHSKIQELLERNKQSLTDLEGIVCYQGPGSFTGLRIGLSVANAMAYGHGIPVAGQTGENWILQGLESLKEGKSVKTVLPEYGADVHITLPRH